MSETNACTPKPHAPPPHPATAAERREQFAAWAKALGHPSRVLIIEILLAQEGCMCGDIAERVGCAQSTVSQHLKILKDAGVIRGTIDGPRICYCVNPLVLARLGAYLADLRHPGESAPDDPADP